MPNCLWLGLSNKGLEIEVKLNSKLLRCVLDTGSSISLINNRAIHKIPSLYVKNCESPLLRMANNSSMSPVGQTTLDIVYNELEHKHLFYIYKDLPFDILLGIDFCKLFNVDIDFSRIKESCDNTFNQLPFNNNYMKKQNKNENHLYVVNNTNIPGSSGKWVKVKSEISLPKEYLFYYDRLFNTKTDLIMSDCINYSNEKNETIIFVINYKSENVCLRKDTKIGRFEQFGDMNLYYIRTDEINKNKCESIVGEPTNTATAVEATAKVVSTTKATAGIPTATKATAHISSPALATAGIPTASIATAGIPAATGPVSRPDAVDVDSLSKIDFKIGENLNPDEYSQIMSFLDKNSHLFAKCLKDLTRTHIIKHNIRTIPHEPISRGPYRCSPKEKQAIEKQIKEMLDANIIRESKSPYASPVVMVVKANGQMRFCVDYRGINAVTIRDSYPIPRIQELMTAFNGSQLFSTLDMASGYWQIEMAEEDIEKTSFITHCGLFDFLVCPFGLCSLPETYQRMIDKMIAGLKWKICVAYLDDIIVYSQDFASHINNLKQVFKAIESANLRMNPSKCHFGLDKIKYLGWIVSAEGTLPDPEKVSIISKMRSPIDKRGIKQFLGITGYYQNSIENYSQIAEPLRRLLSKNSEFIWTEEQEAAVITLKHKLITAPVRVHYDPDKPIRVQSDASTSGIGYVLAHVIDNQEHPFRFGGRALKPCEENYTVTELEALAFYEAITKNREYLLGRQFEVITDHCALCWILKAVETKPRVTRWVQKLSEYEFVIKYKRGSAHSNADTISRQFERRMREAAEEAAAELEDDETEERYVFFNEKIDVAAIQRNDDWCRKIIDRISQSTKPVRLGGKVYEMIDNILYRVIDNGHDKVRQMCVPRELRKDIMFTLHADRSSAHFGIAKTFDKLRRRFFFPKMFRAVEQYVKCCLDCQTRKPTPGFKYGLGQIMEIPTVPFKSIATDLLGRFPKSNSGNQYIIVISDHATRYTITKAIPDQTAKTVAKVLVENVFLVYGAPERILSDNGRQYCSNLVQEVLRLVGTKHVRTTSYHPECNAIVENFNKTLATALSMYCNTDQLNWDDALPYITWAYNTSRNATTQFSPYFLLFGREPRLFIDNVLKLPSSNECLDDIIVQMQDALTLAKDFTIETQCRNKLFYDAKHKTHPFKYGDKVMVYTPVRRVGKSEKLLHRYFGPFIVEEITSPVNVRVVSLDGKRGEVVHIGRLKKFYDEQEVECVNCDRAHEFNIQPGGGCSTSEEPVVGHQRSISIGPNHNGESEVSGYRQERETRENSVQLPGIVTSDVNNMNFAKGIIEQRSIVNKSNDGPVIDKLKRKYTKRFLTSTIRKSTRLKKVPNRFSNQ